MSEPVTTNEIVCVDSGSKSILPTGRLKVQEGQLYQEARVIVHRDHGEEKMGMSLRWFPVPQKIIDAVKAFAVKDAPKTSS